MDKQDWIDWARHKALGTDCRQTVVSAWNRIVNTAGPEIRKPKTAMSGSAVRFSWDDRYRDQFLCIYCYKDYTKIYSGGDEGKKEICWNPMEEPFPENFIKDTSVMKRARSKMFVTLREMSLEINYYVAPFVPVVFFLIVVFCLLTGKTP